MKRQIGRNVYTIGTPRWSRMKWGIIIGIGDLNHYIVQYECGRRAWIHKERDILFWK
ncbi:hypothetical protein ACFYKX_11255 [Cytobacillus sp. FJAT-54145]|uniref:Uncharacterized protein n=1 Tax=Cytobacillus spartinae TaxID=3299023 RepID=A0ABW6KAG0_9BACI